MALRNIWRVTHSSSSDEEEHEDEVKGTPPGTVPPIPRLKWQWRIATPQSDSRGTGSPSALLQATPPWLRGGTQAPRSLRAALNTVSPEGEMLDDEPHELQCIMHAEEVENPVGQDTVLQTELDEHEYEQEVDEEDSDDSDDEGPLAPAAAPSASTALVTASSACTSVRSSSKLAVTRATHQEDLQQTALSGKACGCNRATARGHASCLDVFSKADLWEFYAEAHGPMASQWAKGRVLMELHKKIWAIKQALPTTDAIGRKYKVPLWC